MSPALLDALLGNLVVSAALALAALALQRCGARPRLVHLLWVLVLAKLLTPPLYHVPLIDTAAPPPAASPGDLSLLAARLPALDVLPLAAGDAALRAAAAPVAWTLGGALAALMVAGSLAIALWTLLRVLRFHRLLARASVPAPPELQCEAERLSALLGLSRCPAVVLTGASLSPLVWWIGGRVRVVLPRDLVEQSERADLRLILGHELAHVRRGDPLVRWLEWFTAVGFWWNPIAWLARRNLRAAEEVCCDALVLEALRPDPHRYASSLLMAAEHLTRAAHRPPALASPFMNGGSLEQRFHMIFSNSPTPQRSFAARALTAACALGALTVGVAGAQERKPPEPRADKPAVVQQTTAADENPAVLELRRLLESGQITRAAARLTFESTLAQSSPVMAKLALRNAAAIEKLDAAVATGRLSPEDAAAKREVVNKELRAIAFHVEILGASPEEARILASVESGTRSPEDAKRALAALKATAWVPEFIAGLGLEPGRAKAVHAALERRAGQGVEAGEAGAWFPVFLVEQGLSPEQVGQVERAALKLAKLRAAGNQGSQLELMAALKKALAAAGFEGEPLSAALDAAPRILNEIRAEGDAFELNPGLAEHLRGAGLTTEQVQLTAGLVQRLAGALGGGMAANGKDGGAGAPGLLERLGLDAEAAGVLKRELGAADFTVEQLDGAIAALTRLLPGMRADGDAWVLEPSLASWFSTELGLSDPQVAKLIEAARKAVAKG